MLFFLENMLFYILLICVQTALGMPCAQWKTAPYIVHQHLPLRARTAHYTILLYYPWPESYESR